MACLECDAQARKYKCPRCDNYCCSFDCFKAHKTAGCAASERESADKPAPTKSLPRRTLHFTTEDTVSAEQLAKLAECEPLKQLLRNEHLRKYLQDIDSSASAWHAMKQAMLEPLFVEFADECLKVVEPTESDVTF